MANKSDSLILPLSLGMMVLSTVKALLRTTAFFRVSKCFSCKSGFPSSTPFFYSQSMTDSFTYFQSVFRDHDSLSEFHTKKESNSSARDSKVDFLEFKERPVEFVDSDFYAASFSIV